MLDSALLPTRPRVLAAPLFSVVASAALFSASAVAAPAQSRTSEVVAEITAANAALPESARSEKYAEMKESAFAFYRGTNHLFWKDLGVSPALQTYGGTSGTRTFLQGDLHVENLGAFDDDQGDVVYALNDFDEAVIGDYQLDVWRMATSIVLVARDSGLFSASEQATLVDAFTESYLDTMERYAGNNRETTTKFVAGNTYGLLDDFLRDVAAGKSRLKMLDKWTIPVGGVRALDTAGNSDLAPPSAAVAEDLVSHMAAYRATLSGAGPSLPESFFTVKSVAERLHAGLGSLGVNRYYLLIEGPSAGQDDDRILDVKAQSTPSAWAYLDAGAVAATSAACDGNMALRVVLAEKALGYRVNDLLGWTTLSDGKSYTVRERSPYKETFDVADLDTLTRFTKLAEQWGAIVATHHARADRDWDGSVFPHSLDGNVDARTDGDHAGVRAKVRSIASDYANQVAYDHASFQANF